MSAISDLLIKQAAAGAIMPSRLLSIVKLNERLIYGEAFAEYTKVGPARFQVTMGFGGEQPALVEVVSSPVEAKMIILDYLVTMARSGRASLPPSGFSPLGAPELPGAPPTPPGGKPPDKT